MREEASGADQKFKEFKIVAYREEQKAHRLVPGTNGNYEDADR